jgi:NADPH2:quinone reductase
MIERVAKPAPGSSALVTGANGGVGQALIELLRIRGVEVLGAAGGRAHDLVRSLGATPIEGRTAPLDEGVRRVRPEGVDVAFDGLGARHFAAAVRATRKGGLAVAYGFTGAMKNGKVALGGVLRTFWSLYVGARLAGRRAEFYGITAIYRKDPGPFREDLPKLFALLAEGKLRPRIAEKLPLLGARGANERLEAGGVDGKLVLVA